MIDVVYIVGKETPCKHCELRYSIRSVEKHLKDYANIFLIGTKPSYLNEQIIEIPYLDIYQNKARNIMAKIKRACLDERISQNFILFNDDYFLLQDKPAPGYPYYYKNSLHDAVRANLGEYAHHCQYTLNLLRRFNLPTLNYDSHYPIVYNKTKFLSMVKAYEWDSPFGYVVKSMYCNHHGIKGELLHDCKISHPFDVKKLKQLNANRIMFSTGQRAINIHMTNYWQELYPNKSKYEND